uniref:Uncharacterized protein n=1 Tax=Timema monikensis TaxID=170555 RepID=A0A7R9E3M3_9NEOP|nr:unnamed protein product [Timema monikensis]
MVCKQNLRIPNILYKSLHFPDANLHRGFHDTIYSTELGKYIADDEKSQCSEGTPSHTELPSPLVHILATQPKPKSPQAFLSYQTRILPPRQWPSVMKVLYKVASTSTNLRIKERTEQSVTVESISFGLKTSDLPRWTRGVIETP